MLLASLSKSGAKGPAWLRQSRAPRLLHRRFVPFGDVVPIDQVIEERLEVVRPSVAIIDVVGMFPYVAAEDGFGAVDQRVLPVRRLHNDDLAILDREPAPARAELGDASLGQVLFDLCERTDVGGDLLLQFAGQLIAATVLLHPLPEMGESQIWCSRARY